MIRDLKRAAFCSAAGIPLANSFKELTVSEYVAMAEWLVRTGRLPDEMKF